MESRDEHIPLAGSNGFALNFSKDFDLWACLFDVRSADESHGNLTDALEIRRNDDGLRAGLVVMTCCMSDLQFMSFRLKDDESIQPGWATFDARVNEGLVLEITDITPAKPPKDLIYNPNKEKAPSVRNEHFRGLPKL